MGITANAQDVILKQDGSEVKAKVIEITDQQIKYKDFDFQSGPTRIINIPEIFMITYENGQKEVFNKSSEKTNIPLSEVVGLISYIDNICVVNTICGFQIMCSDLPNKMTWEDAKRACPSGYHLPNYDEMKCMCKEHSPNYRSGFITNSSSAVMYNYNTNYRQSLYRPNFSVASTSTSTPNYKNYGEIATLQIAEREYWTSSVTEKGKSISLTTDDAKSEPNKARKKFYVRCVKD